MGAPIPPLDEPDSAVDFDRRAALLGEGNCPYCAVRLERLQREKTGAWGGCSCCGQTYQLGYDDDGVTPLIAMTGWPEHDSGEGPCPHEKEVWAWLDDEDDTGVLKLGEKAYSLGETRS